MKGHEYAAAIALPDQRVAACGDWHSNSGWARMVGRALKYLAPDVTTMLHLGDWCMSPGVVDEVFAGTDITRIYVTVGNHEQFNEITPLLNEHPGSAVRVSEIAWLLPRPARLFIGGRSVISLGRAASVDRERLKEGVNWWPEEAIKDENVAAAIAGGPADLMLTHESPPNTPVRRVREILRTNPNGFTDTARAESAASRGRVSKVWDAVHPDLLVHGHLHVAGGGRADDGRRVASLGRDGQEGNVGILDLRTLTMTTPSLRAMRESAERFEDRSVERDRRMSSVAEALHSATLDGRRPSPAAIQDAWDYIDGRRTLEELIEDVKRRHTRHPKDE